MTDRDKVIILKYTIILACCYILAMYGLFDGCMLVVMTGVWGKMIIRSYMNAKCKMQNAKCKMHNYEFCILNYALEWGFYI